MAQNKINLPQAMAFNVAVLKHGGMIPLKSNFEYVRYLWLTITLLLSVLNLITVVVGLFVKSSETETDYPKRVFFFFGFLANALKSIQMIRKSDIIVDSAKILQNEAVRFEYKFSSNSNISAHKIEYLTSKCTRLWLFGLVIIDILYISQPLYGILFKDQNELEEKLVGLPINSWYPFDKNDKRFHKIIYTLESLFIINSSYYFGTSQCVCFSFAFHLISRFRILQNVLRNLREIALTRFGKCLAEQEECLTQQEGTSNSSRVTYEGTSLVYRKIHERVGTTRGCPKSRETEKLILNKKSEIQLEMNRCLVDCIQYHQLLLRLSEDLEVFMSPVLLVEVVMGIVLLCTLSLQAVLMDTKTMELTVIIYTTGMVTLSLFFFSLIMTELASQSAAVSQAAYDSEWCNAPRSYKMGIQTIIMRAQKPVVLTAGKFSQFTLEEFSKVLQITYTNFAVLRKLSS